MEQTGHLELRGHAPDGLDAFIVGRAVDCGKSARFEDFASQLNETRKEDHLLIDNSPFSR